jgi:GDPmannose 4,6-dehydratase
VKPGRRDRARRPRVFPARRGGNAAGRPDQGQGKLGWEPEITAREMCAEMVEEDLKIARRHALLKEHGLDMPVSLEAEASSAPTEAGCPT